MAAFRLMPKRSPTFKTCSKATAGTKRSSLLFAAAAVALANVAAAPNAHAPSALTTLDAVLQARKAALSAMHLRASKSIEIAGSIVGGDLIGAFHHWSAGANSREDDELASHVVRIIRLGDRTYVVNETGNVRELRGVLARHQRTQGFIENGDFV